MIKVLVVDDSPVAREFLAHMLGSDSDIKVIGTAANGEEAVEAARKLNPDVIAMDIHMPKMDGFEATRRIMETQPRPIVIVTGSLMAKEVSTAMQAIEAGALAVVKKPKGFGHPGHEKSAAEFVQTVKLMAEVKVVKRWARIRPQPAAEAEPQLQEIKIVAIGTSTGGPPVLQTILSRLPKDFPVPVLIVQHMAAGFIEGFAEWLSQSSPMPVHVATHGEYILPGHVYVAPDEVQMKVERNGRIYLTKDGQENGLRPSISYLFRSVAEVFGQNAIGVLLTGMGKDGAEELKLMKDKGAVTIVQDNESSVVHGIPGEAIKLDAAQHVLPPEKIASALVSLVNRRRKT